MKQRTPITTVGALVTGPLQRILIVRSTKWRGSWGVPGGKVEWGESLEQALCREFREEVALPLERVEFALLQEAVDDAQFHRPTHMLLINFFAFSPRAEVQPNEEIETWAWVTPEQALSHPLNSFTQTLVRRYIDLDVGRRYGLPPVNPDAQIR